MKTFLNLDTSEFNCKLISLKSLLFLYYEKVIPHLINFEELYLGRLDMGVQSFGQAVYTVKFLYQNYPGLLENLRGILARLANVEWGFCTPC